MSRRWTPLPFDLTGIHLEPPVLRIGAQTGLQGRGEEAMPPPELEAGELRELVYRRVRNPAPLAGGPEPGDLTARVVGGRVPERRFGFDSSSTYDRSADAPESKNRWRAAATEYVCEWYTAASGS